jgi:hypothetical protein
MANESLTDKFPIPVSTTAGVAFSQSLNVIQQFCHCFTGDQLASLNTWFGTVVMIAVAVWQYKNVWSKASVAKVLDAHSPGLTTAEAKVIAQEGPAAPGSTP